MKKQCIWGMLAVSLFLAVVLSPFASSWPDGLEKVAELKGFLHLGEENSFWQHSPMPDYKASALLHENASTAVAGLAGTLVVVGLGWLLGKALRRRVRK
jgi:cobalt/nickel transport protein